MTLAAQELVKAYFLTLRFPSCLYAPGGFMLLGTDPTKSLILQSVHVKQRPTAERQADRWESTMSLLFTVSLSFWFALVCESTR
jgi:hypothetical protein